MFNPLLSQLQFLLLLTALAALVGGYLLHARLLPWIKHKYQTRPRYFIPHPYQARQAKPDAPEEPTDHPA